MNVMARNQAHDRSELLRQVIELRCRELEPKVSAGGVQGLSAPERATLVQAIGDEFIASGLGEDDEPTPRGLALETLLDYVNRMPRLEE